MTVETDSDDAPRRRGTLSLSGGMRGKPREPAAEPPAAAPASAGPASGARRLQEAFLDEMKRSRVRLTIYLANGARVEGVVVDYDQYCFLLEQNGRLQLVYKHAISTDAPKEPASIPGDVQGVSRDVGAPAHTKPRPKPRAPTVERVRRRPLPPRAR